MSNKKSFRNITIYNQKFYFRRDGLLTGNIVDERLTITFSPYDNKHNYLSVCFPLSAINVPPSSYSGVDKNNPHPGFLTPCFFHAKAVNHGEEVVIEFGKTRIISEILGFILEHKLWDTHSRNINEQIDGWEILSKLGYSDFLPHLTWSW